MYPIPRAQKAPRYQEREPPTRTRSREQDENHEMETMGPSRRSFTAFNRGLESPARELLLGVFQIDDFTLPMEPERLEGLGFIPNGTRLDKALAIIQCLGSQPLEATFEKWVNCDDFRGQGVYGIVYSCALLQCKDGLAPAFLGLEGQRIIRKYGTFDDTKMALRRRSDNQDAVAWRDRARKMGIPMGNLDWENELFVSQMSFNYERERSAREAYIMYLTTLLVINGNVPHFPFLYRYEETLSGIQLPDAEEADFPAIPGGLFYQEDRGRPWGQVIKETVSDYLKTVQWVEEMEIQLAVVDLLLKTRLISLEEYVNTERKRLWFTHDKYTVQKQTYNNIQSQEGEMDHATYQEKTAQIYRVYQQSQKRNHEMEVFEAMLTELKNRDIDTQYTPMEDLYPYIENEFRPSLAEEVRAAREQLDLLKPPFMHYVNEDMIRLVAQVLLTMASMSDVLKIVHKDLHLNNFLIEPTDAQVNVYRFADMELFVYNTGVNLTMIDFGLAKKRDHQTMRLCDDVRYFRKRLYKLLAQQYLSFNMGPFQPVSEIEEDAMVTHFPEIHAFFEGVLTDMDQLMNGVQLDISGVDLAIIVKRQFDHLKGLNIDALLPMDQVTYHPFTPLKVPLGYGIRTVIPQDDAQLLSIDPVHIDLA